MTCMMSGTAVLSHTLLSLVPEDPTQSRQVSHGLSEMPCLSMLKRCQNMKEFKQFHAQVLKLGLFANSFCASNFMATCALSSWGCMEHASSIFRQIDEPGAWEFNTMIRGYVKDASFDDALFLYIQMVNDGIVPDNFTFPALLKACSQLQDLKLGMQIHGQALKLGLEDDVYVQNSLISMYGKCKEIEHSRAVFEKIKNKNVASWSAIIAAHAGFGLWSECLMLFEEMNSEGCWRAEESILVNVLSACTHLGALGWGKCAHGYLLKNISSLNIIVETSLIDMYVKCGALDRGLCIFKNMATKNRLSYSVMISGFAMHHCAGEAIRLFWEMLEEGLSPDDVVYVSVLSACSRAGLVEEGMRIFNGIKFEHQTELTIQHYGCMVDLFCQAGLLNEALEFINSMPIKPNDVIWRTLLYACKVRDNVEIGEIAAKNLSNLKSQYPGDYVLLSHFYAQARRWQDVARTRTGWRDAVRTQTKIPKKGFNEISGFCIVEVEGKRYKFVSQDKSHPQSVGIYEMIHQMEWQLKFEGYSADISVVLQNVDEEEKRERLRGHSQKLSIAFALINTSEGSPIRITRNVRMCSDCHTYTKFISVIYGRQIFVRDRNQFHHFKDGTCSCRDFW